ncbi:hypothetical protein GCK72_004430 [Caenorhabditis remanei]|uniref:Uncharacterized protein n=1 Tax=Caenorhabditis remanei TaxID=31234 RepID=A0A6A5HDU6_CAERE|nr:hypothetical protein GCK72_004430 [Caenorhabditis remanei]KAF1764482.1 hypothetical protein GCK72_004430 [Caenorhabditis remanei]
MDQNSTATLINAMFLTSSIMIIQLFLMAQQYADYPTRGGSNYDNYSFYSFYTSFLWIASVYISNSDFVQNWIQTNKKVENSNEKPMFSIYVLDSKI